MIRTLFFDFGNVLGRFDHWRSVVRLAKHTHLTPEELYALILENDLEDEFEHGHLTATEYAAEAIRRGKLSLTPAEFVPLFEDIFTPNREVLDLIPKLAAKHRLILASNTNDIHYAFYRRQFAEWLSHFSALPASHLARVRKPKPGFFAFCQQFAEAAPGECAFIDDLPENVAAGEKHGWKGIHYRPGDDFAAKLTGAGILIG
jgi:glucose-1-phosphatase